jgi:uncharacterized damage-inducible protein DinB
MGRVTDERLSRAIVAYIGGVPNFDKRPVEVRVQAAVGGDVADLIATIQSIMAEVDAEWQTFWRAADLREMGDWIEAFVQSRHPEVDDAALSHIGNHFTYNWK